MPALEKLHIFDSPYHAWQCCEDHGAFKYANAKQGDWFDGLTKPQAKKFSRHGCDAIVPIAQHMLSQFDAQLETLSFEYQPDVQGFAVNVPDYLAGEPECMTGMTFDPSNTGPLNIAVCLESGCRACDNLNCLCEPVEPTQYKLRGAAIMALVMRLAAIRPVNLIAVHVAHGHLDRTGNVGDDKFYAHERYAYTSAAALGVRINTAPMDLASAGFVLCHVGYARSILYGIQAKAQGAMKSSVSGAPGPGLTFAAMADDDGRIPSPRHWYHDERIGNAERAVRNSQRYCDAVLRLLEWDSADSVVIPPSQKHLQSIDDGIAWIKANMGRLAPAQE